MAAREQKSVTDCNYCYNTTAITCFYFFILVRLWFKRQVIGTCKPDGKHTLFGESESLGSLACLTCLRRGQLRSSQWHWPNQHLHYLHLRGLQPKQRRTRPLRPFQRSSLHRRCRRKSCCGEVRMQSPNRHRQCRCCGRCALRACRPKRQHGHGNLRHPSWSVVGRGVLES